MIFEFIFIDRFAKTQGLHVGWRPSDAYVLSLGSSPRTYQPTVTLRAKRWKIHSSLTGDLQVGKLCPAQGRVLMFVG